MKMPRRLWAAALGSLLLKLALAWNTFGTNDILLWQGAAQRIETQGIAALYRERIPEVYQGRELVLELYNHPPMVSYGLAGLSRLERTSGVPLRFWLRAVSSLADVVSTVLVWRLTSSAFAASIMALSPLAVMLSGYHGNTDPLIQMFLLLSALLLQRGLERAGSLAFGMALNIKIVPLLVLPAFWFSFANLRARARFLLLAGGLWAVVSAPVLLQEPWGVFQHVFLYTGSYGRWGWARLIHGLAPESTLDLFARIGGLALLFPILGWFGWRMRNAPLYDRVGAQLIAFYAVTPSFGIQYLGWATAWLAGLGRRWAYAFLALSSTFAFMVYHYWAGSVLPWWFSNALAERWWGGWAEVTSWVLWLLCAVWTVSSTGAKMGGQGTIRKR